MDKDTTSKEGELDKILNKFNLKPEDIDNYVILNGPGSFTGVRVGVTVSKTLAWTLSKKINHSMSFVNDFSTKNLFFLFFRPLCV